MDKSADLFSRDDEIGCLGEYDRHNSTSCRVCALRLRCAVESDENSRLEMLEDLVYGADMFMKLQ